MMRPALMALLPLLSCAHIAKVGDVCKDAEAYCLDSHVSLACRDAHLAKFFCGGPGGCAVDSARNVTCDQSSGAIAATPCFPEYEGRAQCSSVLTAAFLQCTQGAWVQLACNPPGTTCQTDTRGLSCR